MKKYGVVVIGCGHIGTEHLSEIYYRDNIELIAVIDTELETARLASKRFNALEYGTDYLPYSTDSRVDIAIIATYTSSHLKIATDFVRQGKHILCEKPIASNLKDGEAFCELVKTAKTKIQIAHILRYNESYKKIKELIDEGRIGELRVIRMVQNHHAVDWSRYKRLLEDCLPIVDCGIHYYDVIRWFTGSEITEVSGFGTKIDEDAPQTNYTVMNFLTESGCRGYYESAWSRNTGAKNVKEFIGTKGRIVLTLQSQRGESWADGDLVRVYRNDSDEYLSMCIHSQYKNMYAQLQGLISCIENDTQPTPSWDDVWKSFTVALAADKAVRSGEKVKLN